MISSKDKMERSC